MHGAAGVIGDSPKAVLLTGAAGSIGRPLVAALIDRGVETIYALEHVASAEVRHPSVRIIRGDITHGGNLGLASADADEVTSTISAVVHAAADTRFDAAPDAAHLANVEGTRNVLAFASGCRRLDRVLALSTAHVAGRRTGIIYEEELEHDCGFVNGYEASKYAAEIELRRQMSRLPVSVCRISTIVGDSRSGTIARRAAVHQAVLLMYAGLAPMVPGEEDSPVDLLALDYAVPAIAWLATRGFSPGRTWHVCAGSETITAGELIDVTLDCFAAYRPAWRRRAIERPVLVDPATFELFRSSIDQAGSVALKSSADVVARFAPQLAYPKRFDTTGLAASLAPAGIRQPDIRQAWRAVVRHLIEPAAATQPSPVHAG